MRSKRTRSMKWGIIRVLIVCWLIPIIFMIAVMGIYIGSNHSDMTAESYRSQLEFNDRICAERLNQIIKDSRQASYDGEILSAREAYLSGHITDENALKVYKSYLDSRYSQSEGISAAILTLHSDGAEDQVSSVYSEKGNGSYQVIRTYRSRDQAEIEAIAAELDTKSKFYVCKDTIYLIRNLVDKKYAVRGTLVFVLNRAYCFQSLFRYPMAESAYIQIDDNERLYSGKTDEAAWTNALLNKNEENYYWFGPVLYTFDDIVQDQYRIRTGIRLNDTVLRYPFYGYQFLVGAMVLSLIVMLIYFLKVFEKRVNRPLEALTDGTERIDAGELGYQIEPISNDREFEAVIKSVNQMSTHLKQQFQKIYEEEIALRDARIMALQSHINPHFMNNTLEIINWEVRLGRTETAGAMIEALAVMMDAAMDRKKRVEISLTEEMQYVNSYLYIMKQRLGERLNVVIDIEEEAMNCLVPRLILQPILENAIDHGAAAGKGSEIRIIGRREGDFLRLCVANEGHLSEAENAKIARLLDPDYDTSKEKAGNLGIANVNQRLRILFGDPCGLTIREEPEGQVSAVLLMPWGQ